MLKESNERNRVAIYARISDSDQKGLDMQQSSMEEYAYRKNAFDTGEFGLGNYTNSLTLDCI